MKRLWLIALASVVIVVACDSVPLTSPTGSTISITADKSVLPLNGQATVQAVLTESSGTVVHNGTVVTFQTTVGTLNPPQAETHNGIATTTFFAGSSSGTAIIHAFSGSVRTGTGNQSSGGATIKVGAAAASGTITMTATPPSVSQSGGTVTISALVFDEADNPLPGVNVQFSTANGTLNPTTATTDANGFARTQLSTIQTTNVSAFAGAAKGDVRVEVSPAPTVSIADLQPTNPVAGSPVSFTVNTSSTNQSAPRQIQTLEVNFGDNQVETRSNVGASTGFTHIYSREGGYTITARAVDVAGNTDAASRALIVTRAVPPTVAIQMTDDTPQVNQSIGFTLTATAGSNGPAVETLRAYIDGNLVFTGTGSNGAFSRTFTAAGTYLLEVQATDLGGSVGRTQRFIVVTP